MLDLVWGGADGVVDYGVSGWCSHTLASSNRDKVELVDVLVSNATVHHGTRQRVLEASRLTSEQAGVHSLAGVDVHQLRSVTNTKA